MVIITGLASMAGTTVTDGLNWFNNFGGFSYIIPFMLIFAVVYAILDKSKILGDNRGLLAIVSVSLGLLSLQFDFVSGFYANIYPRLGIGLSVFLSLMIFLGFFYPQDKEGKWSGSVKWIGWLVGIGVVIWSFSSWDQWGYYSGFGGWFSENIWALIVFSGIVAIIIYATRKPKEGKT